MSANAPRSNLLTYLLGLLVLIAALGIRVYYLHEFQFVDSPPSQVWQVQGRGLISVPPDTTELDQLVANIKKDGIINGFQSKAPLGPDKEELTGHRAPLYPVFRAGIEQGAEKVNEYVTISQPAAVRYLLSLIHI